MINNRGILPEIDDKELVSRKGETIVLDTELYENYWLIMFRFGDGKIVYFEGIDINKKKLLWILENFEIVTFNGIKFDIPLILHFLYNNPMIEELKHWGNELVGGMTPYKFYKALKIPQKGVHINHIDIMEVAFGKSSLKTYAGRIHAPYMQDLPYEHFLVLNEKQKNKVLRYCVNDCINTKELFDYLKKDIDLRRELSIQYSADVRSKSDAQIAEVVIGRELQLRYGIIASKTSRPEGHTFKYNVPENISFKTKQMQHVLEIVRNADFKLENGSVKMPSEIANLKITIGESIYQMGIGGLHSTESRRTRKSDNQFRLVDRDVASYYPMIILMQKLYPSHLGPDFLKVYKGIVDRRLKAKAEGDKSTANTLKIVINGSFGKFGNEHSILFSPELMIQVTISGQLYLLMLIEAIEEAGMRVVSGNTDGFVTMVDRSREDEFLEIVTWWETLTGFTTEETEYEALYSRDVNSYIAIQPNGEIKVKGAYATTSISKNPSGQIIIDAVKEYLLKGTPVEETIEKCSDIKKFVFVRKVDGGCVDSEGNEIGKVIRYYYRKGQFLPLRYKKNGNKVPQSDGAYPIMDLSVDMPQDIDYAFYSHKAREILNSDFSKPEQLDLF